MNDLPTDSHSTKAEIETITLGGGCFWCTEAVFDEVIGVTDVVSGYINGHTVNPTYEQICDGDTGHAEVVRVAFDPAVISYEDILAIFFAIHDPTSLNQQGADRGTQYRSGIYVHSTAQRAAAEAMIARLNAEKIWDKPIVTEVAEAAVFYPAEDYHQTYFKRNPNQGYCMAVVSPKVAKFRKSFAHRLKK